ncbi:MAG: hypothetical protein WKF54_05400 [Nocardioidaceae bacterium]
MTVIEVILLARQGVLERTGSDPVAVSSAATAWGWSAPPRSCEAGLARTIKPESGTEWEHGVWMSPEWRP